MKYISLDEVMKILARISTNSIGEIEKLKTIDLSIIDEMIEEKVYRHNYSLIDDTETDELSWAIKALKALKERLLSNK